MAISVVYSCVGILSETLASLSLSRLDNIRKFINSQSTLLQEYDEDIVKKILLKIIVGNDEITAVLQTGKSIKLKKYQK